MIVGRSVRVTDTYKYFFDVGNPSSPPSAPPSSVFVRQIRTDPLRIEMGWAPMACLQQHSAITDYLVHFGRTNTTEIRTVTTRGTYIVSQMSNADKGLGVLNIGQEYWFRVAARNANGQGPFSATLRATPLSFISGEYMCFMINKGQHEFRGIPPY